MRWFHAGRPGGWSGHREIPEALMCGVLWGDRTEPAWEGLGGSTTPVLSWS